MTPTRLRECLDACHWSQRGLARILNRDEGTVRQWARGAVPIPEDVAQWIAKVDQHMRDNPAPARVRLERKA